jgi:valyl-tRNA synthetase
MKVYKKESVRNMDSLKKLFDEFPGMKEVMEKLGHLEIEFVDEETFTNTNGEILDLHFEESLKLAFDNKKKIDINLVSNEIIRLNKMKNEIEIKLSNEKFLKNAKEEIVVREKVKLEDVLFKIKKLKELI